MMDASRYAGDEGVSLTPDGAAEASFRLRDEFAFINDVAADPLLDSYLERARKLLDTSLQSPTERELLIQGP
jgi:hypothetical protein